MNKKFSKAFDKVRNVVNIMLCVYILVGLVVMGTGQPKETTAVTTSVSKWALYGEKLKVIYCNDNCIYWYQFLDAVKIWNKEKKGVLKKAGKGDHVTCRVQNLVEISTMNGRTYASGFIVFNPNGMRKLTKNEKLNVAIHEIGHALGLWHNGYWDVMNPTRCSNIKLSANDKASFKAAYKKFITSRWD